MKITQNGDLTLLENLTLPLDDVVKIIKEKAHIVRPIGLTISKKDGTNLSIALNNIYHFLYKIQKAKIIVKGDVHLTQPSLLFFDLILTDIGSDLISKECTVVNGNEKVSINLTNINLTKTDFEQVGIYVNNGLGEYQQQIRVYLICSDYKLTFKEAKVIYIDYIKNNNLIFLEDSPSLYLFQKQEDDKLTLRPSIQIINMQEIFKEF